MAQANFCAPNPAELIRIWQFNVIGSEPAVSTLIPVFSGLPLTAGLEMLLSLRNFPYRLDRQALMHGIYNSGRGEWSALTAFRLGSSCLNFPPKKDR